MRIAVYHNLPSGGAKRALYEITKRLSTQHELDVYTFASADHTFGDLRPYARQHKEYQFVSSELYRSPFGRLNMLVRRRDLERIQHLGKQIAEDIKRCDYDVVFVNPCQVETSPSLLRYLDDLPSVYYCQEPPRVLYEKTPQRSYEKRSTKRELLDKIDPLPGYYFTKLRQDDQNNYHAADIVLVNSKFMQSSVTKIYQQTPEVCYLGTDVDYFQPQELPKKPIFLTVGSLTPLKNFDFLLQALATVPKKERPELWIASNFQNLPERAFLERLADELEVSLCLKGSIDDQELVRLYNTASVTIYSPIREPFGLVPIESMACGTPVVSVKEGGMQETILDGETGYLVERDPEIFAQAAMTLLCNPELAEKFGKAGRKHVEQNWSWDQASQRVENYLTSAAAKN